MSILKIPRQIARALWGAYAKAARKPSLREERWGNDFPDTRFLLIRRDDNVAGLFSHFVTNLGWVKYAEDHGMLPVVDMGHYRNLYLTWFEFLFTRTNSWEFFFKQPGGYSVKDIRHARSVTIVEGVPPDEIGYPSPRTCLDAGMSEKLKAWIDTALRTMFVQDGALVPYCNDEFEQEVNNGIIGVLARGTDYTEFRPHGHPIQPTARQLIEAVNEYSADGHAHEKIFLVTEDGRIAEEFRQEYGERLMLAKQPFVDYHGGWLCENSSVNHNRERGFAYLKAIVDLSRCSSLFAGRTSGSIGSLLLSKGFQKTHFFDLGLYP